MSVTSEKTIKFVPGFGVVGVVSNTAIYRQNYTWQLQNFPSGKRWLTVFNRLNLVDENPDFSGITEGE